MTTPLPSWYRHLPDEVMPCRPSAWHPQRVLIARALVEHHYDERVARWAMTEPATLDRLVRAERVPEPMELFPNA